MNIVRREDISKPGAKLKVTRLVLSDEAKERIAKALRAGRALANR